MPCNSNSNGRNPEPLLDLGTDIIGNNPEEFATQIRDKCEKRAKVARDAGIKPA